MESTDHNVVLNLPDEVLSEICSHLSELDDRKSFRSTCRLFYGVSNRSRFLMKEEMVFYGTPNMNSHMATLALCNSPRKIWNIRLNQMYLVGDVADLFVEFFSKKGPQIYSLTLDKCEMGAGVLRDMIKYCTNLRSLSLMYSEVIGKNIFADFEYLEKNGIARKTVKNFCLKQGDWPYCHEITLTNRKFLRFFSVFPNIKNLVVIVEINGRFNQFSTISSDIMSDTEFSFSSVHHQLLKMRQQLEYLTLHFNYHPTYYWCFSIQTMSQLSDIHFENMRKLSLNLHNFREQFTTDILVKFNHLTDFECTYEANYPHSTTSLFSLLLSNAPGLRSLIIKLYDFSDCHWNEEFSKAVSKSQLINLKIFPAKNIRKDTVLIPKESVSISNDLHDSRVPINFTLKQLCLFPSRSRFHFSHITKFFRGLESLVIDQVCLVSLFNLLNYQIYLRRLIIINRQYSDFYQQFGRSSPPQFLPYNYSEFKNLTHLCFADFQSFALIKFLLSKFEFPKLKSLTIIVKIEKYFVNVNSNYNADQVWPIIQKFTQLVYLYLEIEWETPPSFIQLSTFLNELPKLRHFYCLGFTSEQIRQCPVHFDYSKYCELLKMYPSLRTIVHGSFKYLKDVVTNTVTKFRFPQDFYQHLYEGLPLPYHAICYSGIDCTSFT